MTGDTSVYTGDLGRGGGLFPVSYTHLAEAYRIDHLVGSISPGRIADILLVDSPEEFHVEAVIANGRPAAKDGRLAFELKAPERSSVLKSVLKCKKTTKADFAYKTSIQNGDVYKRQGKYCVNSFCATLHISPFSLKRIHRLLVVPESSAITYLAIVKPSFL